MIRKIVLENYMAHVRTVIEPAQGLTVLIGPNNCGKSAIIHALEMICYNSDAADYAIRHGAKKAVVTIETQDEDGAAHTITWWRKEKTAGYIIDGREISGLGKGKIPDDLHQHLRMPMIESGAGGKEFLLHFGLQKSPIFLLDDPASRAAQFFASATDADKLVQMQKAHQQKVMYAKREKDKLDGELEQLDRQLGALAPLSELSNRLGNLENDHRKLTDLDTSIGALSACVQALNHAENSAAISVTQIEALASLQKPPTLRDTQKIREWIDATERYLSETARNLACGRALRQLRKPPELAKTDRLRQICNDIDDAMRRMAIEQGRANALVRLSPPTQPHDIAAIKGAIDGLRKSEELKAKCHDRNAFLAGLAAPPSLHDTGDLKKRIDEIGNAVNARDRLKAQARRLSHLTPPLERVVHFTPLLSS